MRLRFKIRKEVSNIGTYYWTIPQGILNKLWYVCFPFNMLCYMSTQGPFDCWLSKEKAVEHIERWNNGYYKKKYYKKYIDVKENVKTK